MKVLWSWQCGRHTYSEEYVRHDESEPEPCATCGTGPLVRTEEVEGTE